MHRRSYSYDGARRADRRRELPRDAERAHPCRRSPPRGSTSWGDRLRFLMQENLPGAFPYTAGVFPTAARRRIPRACSRARGRRSAPTAASTTSRRASRRVRLSTAFDSVTLYGEDPAERPDIYGKVGNSGVSVAHPRRREEALLRLRSLRAHDIGLDDDQRAGADHPRLLPQRRDRPAGREAPARDRRVGGGRAQVAVLAPARPAYRGELPATSDGLGLGLLGVSGASVVDAETYERIKRRDAATVRGTVQADILKEDQAQNTCIFSTEFALRMMGDIQEYFIDRTRCGTSTGSRSAATTSPRPARTRSPSSRSRSRTASRSWSTTSRAGWTIDDFAPNLSFFFSNGMDPEYSVIGRVARRIWARRDARALRRRARAARC